MMTDEFRKVVGPKGGAPGKRSRRFAALSRWRRWLEKETARGGRAARWSRGVFPQTG